MRVCLIFLPSAPKLSLFFFNDTATTEIYTLSLHDALPILSPHPAGPRRRLLIAVLAAAAAAACCEPSDRKSTRLNSSHLVISYAVFCLKKKKITTSTSASDRFTAS